MTSFFEQSNVGILYKCDDELTHWLEMDDVRTI